MRRLSRAPVGFGAASDCRVATSWRGERWTGCWRLTHRWLTGGGRRPTVPTLNQHLLRPHCRCGRHQRLQLVVCRLPIRSTGSSWPLPQRWRGTAANSACGSTSRASAICKRCVMRGALPRLCRPQRQRSQPRRPVSIYFRGFITTSAHPIFRVSNAAFCHTAAAPARPVAAPVSLLQPGPSASAGKYLF